MLRIITNPKHYFYYIYQKEAELIQFKEKFE